jgi:hypothetical protein
MIGFVYAIESGDAVKIGWAGDPFRRLSELNVGSPDDHKLLGYIPATKDQERELHGLCAAHRIRGEWFRKEGPVLFFVESLPPIKPRNIPVTVDGESIGKLIDELGGALAVGLALGVNSSHVRVMRTRRSIPIRYWPRLISLARSLDYKLTERDLVAMHIASEAIEGAA